MRLGRNVAILAVMLAIIGGGFYFLKKMPDPSKNTTETKTETISLFKASKTDITQVDIKNQKAKFSLVKADEESWFIKGFEGAPLSTSMVDSLLYALVDVEAEALIEENPQDLEKYGLSSPQASMLISVADGSSHQFSLGNPTITQSEYYLLDGGKVYTVTKSFAEKMLSTPGDYREKQVASFESKDIKEVSIAGSNKRILIRLKEDYDKIADNLGVISRWEMIEPYQRSCGNEELNNLLFKYIGSISALSFVEDTNPDLSKYGLSPPEYTVKTTLLDGRVITYLIGKKTENGRYAKTEDSPSVFTIAEEDLKFLELTGYELIEKFVALVSIDKFTSIQVSANGKTANFGVEGTGDDAIYLLNGAEVNTDKFKDLYQKMVGLTIDGEIENTEMVNVNKSIVYRLSDGSTINIEFGDFDERNYAVYINGKSEFFIRKKKVDSFLSVLDEFIKNPY